MREPWSVYHDAIIFMVNAGDTVAQVAVTLGTDPKKTGAEISRLRAKGLLPRAPNTKIRFTTEMDEALRAAVAAGSSFKEHARQVGVSCDVIQRRAKNLGLRSSHLVECDWDAAKPTILAMRAAGATWKKIGKAVGASDSSVRRMAEIYQLPKRAPKDSRRPKSDNSFWTEARKSVVVACLAAGNSREQIAEAIGDGASRASVCGIVVRMKQNGEIPPDVLAQMAEVMAENRAKGLASMAQWRASQPKREKPLRVKRERVPKAEKLPKALPAPAAARAPLPSFTKLAAEREPFDLMDLKPGMCRWPFGETAPFKFCGCRVSLGSYCPAHTAVAHPAGRVATVGADELGASKFKIDGGAEWLRA